jgi:hypothetical protein
MGIPAHVPFQNLIDLAITFMRRVPPRKLLALAQRYYGPEQSEPMLRLYPEISFFHPPPTWALAGFAKADWVEKQRARERRGISSKSRKDRRVLSELHNRNNTITTGEDILPSKASIGHQKHSENNKSLATAADDKSQEQCTPEMVEVSARELKWPTAMIAQGFGPGEDGVARRKKRRRVMLIGGAATVALVAIAFSVAMKSQEQSTPQIQRQDSVPPADAPKKLSNSNKSTKSPRMHLPISSSLSSSTTSSSKSSRTKKVSDLVGSMKTAAKDLFTEPDATSSDCPANDIPVRMPPPERKSSPPKPAPFSAVSAPVNASPNNSLIQAIAQRMIVNQLKAMALQIQWLLKKIDHNVTSPTGRAHLQQIAAEYVKTATTFVVDAFKFTGQHAREHLGGDNLEDLGLL